MSDLAYANVDDSDDGDALLQKLDAAHDELATEVRTSTTSRIAAANDVREARDAITDRIWRLSEALQEARRALSDQEDLAEARQAQIDAVEATLTEREETIEQLRVELAEVQRA